MRLQSRSWDIPSHDRSVHSCKLEILEQIAHPRAYEASAIWLASILLVVSIGAQPGWCALEDWESLGPFGGCESGLLMDPVDPNILYSLSSYEGVFKSTDGGGTWRWLHSGYDMERFNWYSALAMSPVNPDELYFHADSYIEDDREASGIYRSLDGGESWEHVWMNDQPISSCDHIAVSPDGVMLADILFGAAENMLTLGRSTDGGRTWEPVAGFRRDIRLLLFHPLDPRLAIHLGSNCLGFSEDAGLTWTLRPLPVPDNFHLVAGAVSPYDPDRAYAIENELFGSESYLFRTLDRGISWEMIMADDFDGSVGVNFFGEPAHIYTYRYYSLDDGQTWQAYNNRPYLVGYSYLFHPDDPARVLYTTDYGLLRLKEDGATWTQQAFCVFPRDLVSDPRDRNILYIAGQEAGVLKSADGGANWRPAGEFDLRYVSKLTMDPNDPDVLYGYGAACLFKSADGARSWQSALGSEFTVYRLALDPFDSHIMLARVTEKDEEGVRTNRTLRSADGGASWERIAALDGRPVASITFHPHIPGLVYATDFNPRLFVSRDSGVIWNGFDAEVPEMTERQEYLHFDSQAEGVLYCTSRYAVGFRKSVDWGATWFDPCPDGPFIWGEDLRYLVDPDRAGTLYCDWRRSTEGAARWKALTPAINLYHVYRQEDDGLVLYGAAKRPEAHGYRWGLFRYVQYDHPSTILMAGYGASRISASAGGRIEVQALVRIPADAPQPVEVELCRAGLPLGLYLADQGAPDPAQPQLHFYSLAVDAPPAEWAGRHDLELVARDKTGMISDRWPRLTVKQP